jgi:hypothetical protein
VLVDGSERLPEGEDPFEDLWVVTIVVEPHVFDLPTLEPMTARSLPSTFVPRRSADQRAMQTE